MMGIRLGCRLRNVVGRTHWLQYIILSIVCCLPVQGCYKVAIHGEVGYVPISLSSLAYIVQIAAFARVGILNIRRCKTETGKGIHVT